MLSHNKVRYLLFFIIPSPKHLFPMGCFEPDAAHNFVKRLFSKKLTKVQNRIAEKKMP